MTLHHGAYLLVVARGAATVGDLRYLLVRTGAVTKNAQHQRALVDMMSVEFVHSDEEDRQLGCEAAKNLEHLRRVSFAVCATFRQHSGAELARQSGLDLRVFDNLPEASEWISLAE